MYPAYVPKKNIIFQEVKPTANETRGERRSENFERILIRLLAVVEIPRLNRSKTGNLGFSTVQLRDFYHT